MHAWKNVRGKGKHQIFKLLLLENVLAYFGIVSNPKSMKDKILFVQS